MSGDRHDPRPATEPLSFTATLMVSAALGLAAGSTVAVVLQDGSVVIPFLVLSLLGSPVVHAARRWPPQVVWRLVAASAVAGGVGLCLGLFVVEEAPMQALGVLGGAAMLAAATVAAGTLAATTMVCTRRRRSGRRSPSQP